MSSNWDRYYLPEIGRGESAVPSHKNPSYSGKLDLPEDLDLNREFLGAFEAMERTNECIFVTGKAGTGKSTLLKYFKSHTAKNVVILAPTGVAAVNVGGQTIHSFFKFPPRIIQPGTVRKKRNRKLIREIDTLIIDEVSMVRVDLMDGIDYALRLNRDAPDVPFGGAQVIFFGDLFQLPPVVEPEAVEILEREYGSPYFFQARAFRKIKPRYIELTKVYRQADGRFLNILNRIRDGRHDEEDLAVLNSRMARETAGGDEGCIVLTSTNRQAAMINERRLAGLPGKAHNFQCSVNKDFDEKSFPTEPVLKLKPGAQVIMLRNDQDRRWVNGTIAEVAELSEETVTVRVNGRLHDVDRAKWERIEYEYNAAKDRIEERVAGTFEQFPLKLAWAITIHKSQGQTFDKVVIDLGHGAFTHGQVYVGLSRCTSLEGIILRKRVFDSDIIFDERIYEFKHRLCD
jgi:ATP-dependent exoDNAse (exonuclease V) alpha subunit